MDFYGIVILSLSLKGHKLCAAGLVPALMSTIINCLPVAQIVLVRIIISF